MSMMLFFGFVGALNALCLAPVLLTLNLLGFVDATGLTLRVVALTVCKGAATSRAEESLLPNSSVILRPIHSLSPLPH